MKTWTPNPYKLRKSEAAQAQKNAVAAQKIRREARDFDKLLKNRKFGGRFHFPTKPKALPKHLNGKTTATMITGEIHDVYDSDGVLTTDKDTTVGIQPAYNLATELTTENYTDKAAISLDGIFQPFSVDGVGGLPSLESPTDEAAIPTVDELNPFTKPANYGAVIGGAELRNISNRESEDQIFDDARSIALRGPIIIAGWGYDTNDKPVPADPEDEDEFLEDVNKRPDTWKVGPLDARWDDDRKLWVASAGDPCDPQNAILDIAVFGNPTGGTFTVPLDVNGVPENIVFVYNSTSAQALTALLGHAGISAGDVTVTAGPFPTATMRIEFTGDLANTDIAIPTANWNLLTGGAGKGVVISLSQLGIA
jgi:hypothetical protein